jgi:hypothetical protein
MQAWIAGTPQAICAISGKHVRLRYVWVWRVDVHTLAYRPVQAESMFS